jgi:uncharacterized membrane protein YqjE
MEDAPRESRGLPPQKLGRGKESTMSNLQRPPPETGALEDTRALEEASTGDLVREALDEAKELVRIEIELAKSEVEKEIERAKKAVVRLGIALAAAVLVLCLLAVSIVLVLGGTALAALLVAAVMLAIVAIAAGAGYAVLPKKPMEPTRDRLKADVRQLKEHVA